MMPSVIQTDRPPTVIQQDTFFAVQRVFLYRSHTFVQYIRALPRISVMVPRNIKVMRHILRTDLAPLIQATGTWTSSGEGFQPGYRSSVFGKGLVVAQYFCRGRGED